MKIALTGGSGGIGQAIIAEALNDGHTIVNVDRTPPAKKQKGVRFVQAKVADYKKLLRAFKGCDAMIHMAAIPTPLHHPYDVVHNNNVVGSYNAMLAAAENGIMRICQASSVNAIGFSYSRAPHFDYFPLDESHPNYCEEAYGLSKWICEQQADAFVRRYEKMRIASMRFHWVVPDRATAAKVFNAANKRAGFHLWAYTRFDEAARACLLSLTAPFKGHEAFYIVAPDTTMDAPTLELAAKYFPKVPVRGKLNGNRSFFDSSKAERLLGWTHPSATEIA